MFSLLRARTRRLLALSVSDSYCVVVVVRGQIMLVFSIFLVDYAGYLILCILICYEEEDDSLLREPVKEAGFDASIGEFSIVFFLSLRR